MENETVHLVRDRGGLGDMVRVAAVADALAALRPVILHGPAEYEELVTGYCPAFDTRRARYRRLGRGPARPRAALPLSVDFLRALRRLAPGRVVDMCLPVLMADMLARRRGVVPLVERTELWARAAGLAETPRPRLFNPYRLADPPVVVLHNRPAGVIRRWPVAWAALLAALFKHEGHRVDTIAEARPWPDLARALGSASLVVAVDSGVLHLAAALGRPVLGLFGPTDGAQTCGVYGPHVRWIQAPEPGACAGRCYGWAERGFEAGPCRHGCQHLAALGPTAVFRRARALLREERPHV